MYEQAFKNIDDTLWKDAGCSSELDYIEQTSWVLFLKYLDDFESERETAAILKTFWRSIKHPLLRVMYPTRSSLRLLSSYCAVLPAYTTNESLLHITQPTAQGQ